MEIEELKEKTIEIVRQELKGLSYKAFFFGSRIAGTASPRSDLDLGIEGHNPVPTEILRTIRTRISALRTLYMVDVVDFYLLSTDFKKVAKTHIQEIELN